MNGALDPAQISVKLSRDDANEILRLLSEDADFYQRFKADPQDALKQANLDVHLRVPEGLELPPAEAIQEFRTKGWWPFPWPFPNPRPYNGGCLAYATIFAIASQTEIDSQSPAS